MIQYINNIKQPRGGVDDTTALILSFDMGLNDIINNIEGKHSTSLTPIYTEGLYGKGLQLSRDNNKYPIYYNLPQSLENSYTLEFNVYINEEQTPYSGKNVILEINNSSPTSYSSNVYINSDKTLYVFNKAISDLSININAYNHIAITYNGELINVFINGVKSNITIRPSSYTNNISKLYLGHISSSKVCFDGVLDNLRVSKDVKYTEDFIVPNKPFTTPYYPNVLSSTDESVTVTFETNIDRLRVYVNDELDTEYNEGLLRNNYIQHYYNKELLNEGNNKIKLEVGYGNYNVYNEFDFTKLPKLSNHATYNTISQRFKDLKERYSKQKESLIEALRLKGISVDDTLKMEDIIPLILYIGGESDGVLPKPPTEDIQPTIEIIGVEENWGTAYINVSSGLVHDEAVDLYIDDVFKNTYYYRSGQVQTISTSVILNKTIQLKTTDGRVSNKYYVESFN